MSEPIRNRAIGMPADRDDELDAAFGLGTLEAGGASLPLHHLAVHARLRGMHAAITVEQTFRNDRDVALEVTYVFPLPALGAISGYTLAIDGRVARGVLLERDQARARYDEAIAAGHVASTLEEDRPEVLAVRVGNLGPGATARVRIGLDLVLPLADDCAVLRLPLVVGARYVPGAPLGLPPVGGGTSPDTHDAPDASRVTPPVAAEPRLCAAMFVEAHGFAEVVASHAVELERGERGLAIRIAEAVADRDVVLRFPLIAHDQAVFVPDPDGAEGTLVVTACAPGRATPAQAALEVAILLDRSGSMAGAKMTDARRAACGIVDSLTGRDRVMVVAFDDRLEVPLGHDLVPATAPQRRRATTFLEAVDARGGTELADALGIALAAFDRAGGDARRRAIVLVTDGQVANEDQLVALVARRASARVLAVAIGPAANQGLCQRLAAATAGAWEGAESDAALGGALDRIARRLLAPALDQLALAVAGATLIEATRAPRRPPRLVAGIPSVLCARLRGRPSHVRLHAVDDHGRGVVRELAVELADAPAMPRIWARLRLRDLEDELVTAGLPAGPGLEDELIETSLRFGVLSRYTAFVAVDDRGRAVAPGAPLERVMQPVIAAAPGGDRAGASQTQAGVLKAKITHMSPEQVRGRPALAASDVFVFAVMLHELATLAKLFYATTEYGFLTELVTEAPVPALPPRFDAIAAVLRAALVRDPARRIKDGAALSAALAGLPCDRAGLAAILARHARPAFTPHGPIAARRRAWWVGERLACEASHLTYAAAFAGPGDPLPDAVVHVRLDDRDPDRDDHHHGGYADPLAIAHPNIARVFGVTDRPRHASVIERVPGCSLHELYSQLRAAKVGLTAEQHAVIALDGAAALAAVHAAGAVHGRLHPYMFIVTPAGRCVLAVPPRAPRGATLPRLELALRGLPFD